MNVALHLKRFGLSPWFASRVGDDDAGRQLVDFLKQNNIKTGLVQHGKTLPTGEVTVHLDSYGNPSYEILEPVAWDNIAWTQKLAEQTEQAGIIVFGTLAARSEITRNTLLNLLNTKAYRILDVNLRPPYDRREIVEMLMSKCDFVKMSIHELSTIAKWLKLPWYSEESVLREMIDQFGLSGVCLTRGENGAALCVRGHFYAHAGYRVDVVDTVGSGDAFLAAMLYSFTERKPPEEALNFACAAGALVASHSGANPEYIIEDVEKLMHAHPSAM